MASETLIYTTLTQAWQIAAVALIAATASRLWGSRRPHLGLLLWTVVFVKCLIPPIWSSPVGVFSWAQLRVEPTRVVATERTELAAGRDLFRGTAAIPPSAVADIREGRSVSLSRAGWPPAAGLLLGVWLAGCLATAGWVFARWRRGRRWIERTRAPCDPGLQRQVAELGRRLGLRRSVELIVCNAPLGPAVAGVFRPRLILPQTLVTGRRFEELVAILSHELIHIRRRDTWLLVVERAAKIVWWFHPLVWYAGNQTARLRERCCDAETVACLGCRPAVYARSLLDVLEHLQVVRRSLSLAPGVRPAEVTLKRLETIMRESSSFRKRTPRCVWLLVGLAAAILLPGSPLVLRSQADPADSPEVAAKIEELESAGRQAGLSAEELEAVMGVAKAVQGNKRLLVKELSSDKATAAEKRALDKLVRMFGHPLENELSELRGMAREAGLTAEETAAAEKVALQAGFDNDAIILLYETGKMSAIEKSAFEKVIALRGHPNSDEIEQLTTAGREAGLTDEQIQTLRGLAARAGWELDQIVEWKLTKKLSEAEAEAVAKLEAGIGPLETVDGGGNAENARAIHQLAKAAGCTDQETAALLAVLRKGEIEDAELIAAVRSGQRTPAAAAGLKKLEALLGKMEDFIASSKTEHVGELLEFAAADNLSAEETGAMLKLACLVNYDLDTAKRLKDAGRLSEVESRVLDKLLEHVGQ